MSISGFSPCFFSLFYCLQTPMQVKTQRKQKSRWLMDSFSFVWNRYHRTFTHLNIVTHLVLFLFPFYYGKHHFCFEKVWVCGIKHSIKLAQTFLSAMVKLITCINTAHSINTAHRSRKNTGSSPFWLSTLLTIGGIEGKWQYPSHGCRNSSKSKVALWELFSDCWNVEWLKEFPSTHWQKRG